ncbi:hypothetical protein QBC45DRAFT_153562 [Copromyces sp. CBS 386.78]|nr:hypothetical protein QBC45DRAFT_153562 [Copromyces sp. CBS 386.78]
MATGGMRFKPSGLVLTVFLFSQKPGARLDHTLRSPRNSHTSDELLLLLLLLLPSLTRSASNLIPPTCLPACHPTPSRESTLEHTYLGLQLLLNVHIVHHFEHPRTPKPTERLQSTLFPVAR